MSEERDASGGAGTFERWALAGSCVLALAAFTAFLVRHDAAAGRAATRDSGSPESGGDLVRVRIGGPSPPGPARPLARESLEDAPAPRQADRPRIVPDPGGSRPATPPAAPPAEREVTVKPGETLSEILERELGTVDGMDEIVRLNGLHDADSIRAGQTLRLPPR